jgi:hypothetical protein
VTPAAAEFWSRVASGALRLTSAEDAAVWRLRAAGHDWTRIAGTICAMRRRRRL